MNNEKKSLNELCAEVEYAWKENGDFSLVDVLARQYPEYADDLRAHAAFLIETELNLQPDALTVAESATRTAETLRSIGTQTIREHAEAAAATPPQPGDAPAAATVLELIRSRTPSLRPKAIANALNVPLKFLFGLGQCAQLPERAVAALASRVQDAFGIARGEVEAVLRSGRATTVLASAEADRPRDILSYAEVIERAKFDPESRRFWQSLDEES